MKRLFLILALVLPAVATATDWLGDVPLGETVNFNFNTLGSDGAPITIAGTPAIEVYEDGGTTQITAGTTLTEDFDTVTGLHNIAIVATGANGYEAGKYYSVVIAGTTPTADSVSILGRVVARFRIVAAENVAGVPTVDIDYVGGTDEATELADEAGIADAVWDEARSGHTTAGTFGEYVLTVLDVAHAEPTGAPAANATLANKIGYLYATMRNKVTVTATEKTYFDDAGAELWDKELTDDGTTYTETEGAAAD